MYKTSDYNRYKEWFPTYEEYATYCRCVNKISVGDLVYLYVGNSGWPSSVKSPTTIVRPVIGLVKRNRILLGSNVAGSGFWKEQEEDFNILESKVKDFDKYHHFWWLNSVDDGYIAKIELNKNFKFTEFGGPH